MLALRDLQGAFYFFWQGFIGASTRVRSLGQEGPLEAERATHSIVPAWRIPWTEEPGGLQSVGSQRV